MRQTDRDTLDALVADYLAKGGKITKCAPGKRTTKKYGGDTKWGDTFLNGQEYDREVWNSGGRTVVNGRVMRCPTLSEYDGDPN